MSYGLERIHRRCVRKMKSFGPQSLAARAHTHESDVLLCWTLGILSVLGPLMSRTILPKVQLAFDCPYFNIFLKNELGMQMPFYLHILLR